MFNAYRGYGRTRRVPCGMPTVITIIISIVVYSFAKQYLNSARLFTSRSSRWIQCVRTGRARPLRVRFARAFVRLGLCSLSMEPFANTVLRRSNRFYRDNNNINVWRDISPKCVRFRYQFTSRRSAQNYRAGLLFFHLYADRVGQTPEFQQSKRYRIRYAPVGPLWLKHGTVPNITFDVLELDKSSFLRIMRLFRGWSRLINARKNMYLAVCQKQFRIRTKFRSVARDYSSVW